MPVKHTSTNPDDFPIFGTMPKSDYMKETADFISMFEYFAPTVGVKWENVRYNKAYISEIIDLIQRRRVYFHIYHNIEMGELNEGSLICFWIMKLKPFHDALNPDIELNLIFALALFTRTVMYTAKMWNKPAHITEQIIKHLRHAFTYRDLSKEAFMAIGESLIG